MAISRTLAALRKQAVAEATFHPDGTLQSVKFIPTWEARAKKQARVDERNSHDKVKYVPGTDIPDDNSPLNPLDTVLQTPSYEMA